MAEQATSTDHQIETWVSNIKGRIEIKRLIPGEKPQAELIAGGAQFTITHAERRLHQGSCQKGMDPFTNGMLSPVEVGESAADFESLADRMVITDAELEDFLRGNGPTVRKKIKALDSEWPLRRLLELAIERDAAPSKQAVIQERLDEVAPKVPQVPYVPDYVPEAGEEQVNASGDEAAGPERGLVD